MGTHRSVLAGAALLVLLGAARPAVAQLHGTTTVGVGISTIRPSAAELTTTARVRPYIARVPPRGWGVAMALNWFEADVSGEFVSVDGQLGTVRIRPLMLGLGYTWVGGRLGISPSVIAGPALNTLDIDEAFEDRFSVGGTKRDAEIGTISLAVRPGVRVTYAIGPRLGVTAFGGYLRNRPTFTIRTPAGDVESRWTADGIVLNAGVVVSLF